MKRRAQPALAVFSFAVAASLPLLLSQSTGCSGKSDVNAATAPAPAASSACAPCPYTPPPASTLVESSTVKIRREVFLVPGANAGPNPANGAVTPADLENVRVVRYRIDADPPQPARLIALLMPGFLGGAASFDALARALVRRSKGGAAIEAWAIDRRANLLEDHHGLEVAAFRRDPELAAGYYLGGQEVEGKSFAGFVPQSDVPYASEWGIATTVGDLRRVVSVVPQGERRGRVALVGHSLGAAIAEEYAAWDFDGVAGAAELSSLVLVDGVAGYEGDTTPPRTQESYEKGGDPAPGGFGTTPGLNDVRKSQRYFTLPLLGTKVYPVAAITAMRALFSPHEIVTDPDRDKVLATLLSLPLVPVMTNRAAFGFAFDVKSNGLAIAAISCGEGSGGPVAPYMSLFGSELIHPSDAAATYDWVEYDQTQPKGNTSLSEFGKVWFDGPGLDFAEWYFPQRLLIDAPIASTLVLEPGDFAYDAYAIRATHGAELDLPIMVAPAQLLAGDVHRFDKLRALVAPIGASRPLAGAARTSPDAFRATGYPALTHIDAIASTDDEGSLPRQWFDELSGFVTMHAPPGGVVIPIQP